MANNNDGNARLDRIEAILERFIEGTDKRVNSNAKAIEALTHDLQEFRYFQEQLVRRFDNFLSEMARDRAESLQDRATAYQRITLLENNQSRLIDIIREINRKVNQSGEQPEVN